jgi:hypothetical protein
MVTAILRPGSLARHLKMSRPEDIVSLPDTPPPPGAARSKSIVTPSAATHSSVVASQADHSGKPPLTIRDLAEGLSRRSTGLVDELHAISLRLLQGEDQRESRLDAKAQGLLVTAGLSLTVAFTFGGMLVGHPEYLSEVTKSTALALFALYVFALMAGLFASGWAVWALKVSGEYRNTCEHDVFNEKELTDADDACGDAEKPVENAKAVAMYRRYITSHYWLIWQKHFSIHERKAKIVKRGQTFFLAFLVLMLAIGGILALAAMYRYQNVPPLSPK